MYLAIIFASITYEGSTANVVLYFALSANPLNPVFTNKSGTPRPLRLAERSAAR